MSLIPVNDSLGIAVIAVTATFAALAVVAVILRLWSRRIQKTPLQWNDYTCLLALVCDSTALRLVLIKYIQFFTLSLLASTVNSE